jgi:hypothetical protein
MSAPLPLDRRIVTKCKVRVDFNIWGQRRIWGQRGIWGNIARPANTGTELIEDGFIVYSSDPTTHHVRLESTGVIIIAVNSELVFVAPPLHEASFPHGVYPNYNNTQPIHITDVVTLNGTPGEFIVDQIREEAYDIRLRETRTGQIKYVPSEQLTFVRPGNGVALPVPPSTVSYVPRYATGRLIKHVDTVTLTGDDDIYSLSLNMRGAGYQITLHRIGNHSSMVDNPSIDRLVYVGPPGTTSIPAPAPAPAPARRMFRVINQPFDLLLADRGIQVVDNVLDEPQLSIRGDLVGPNRIARAKIDELSARIGRLHKLTDLAKEYCRGVGMGPQLTSMDQLLTDRGNEARIRLQEYVRSAYSVSGALRTGIETAREEDQVYTALIDSIFEWITPLTEPVTVYRKWGQSFPALDAARVSTVEIDFADRSYLSTSLCLQISNETNFHGEDHTAQYARIDLMPGVKVLPLIDWESWSQYSAVGKTQCEILLQRNARLHKVLGSTQGEFAWGRSVRPPQGVKIISEGSNPDAPAKDLPRIQHHFIVYPDGLGEFVVQYPDGEEKPGRSGGGKNSINLVQQFKMYLYPKQKRTRRTRRTRTRKHIKKRKPFF